MLKFLNSPGPRIVTVLLLLQAALLYSAVRPEFVPDSRPLEGMPTKLGSWQLAQIGVIDQETLDVLKADDILNRTYCTSPTGDCVRTQQGTVANLFVAGFRTQRSGKTPHSPKNCLPGSGFVPISSGEMTLDVGLAAPITVNRYVVASGSQRDLVLYWYQSRGRVVADEYKAKFWVMADAIRLNRTDTALVRVIVPLTGKDETQAQAAATDFVKSFYSTLLTYLPS